MVGIEVFICGSILICNAVLIAIQLTSNRNRDNTTDVAKSSESASDLNNPMHDHPDRIIHDRGIAPSKFNVDEFMARIASEVISDVRKELHGLMSDYIGEVKEQDVEFVPDSEIDTFTPAKITPLDTDGIDEAFNTDMRNIDDAPPSAPIATGHSIDEIEQAVETAMNPKSSDEELAAAGNILESYKETNLYDAIASNEEIDRRVELCLRLSIQSELSLKRIPAKKNTSSKQNDSTTAKKTISRSLSVDLDKVDPDTFDVADILKK